MSQYGRAHSSPKVQQSFFLHCIQRGVLHHKTGPKTTYVTSLDRNILSCYFKHITCYKSVGSFPGLPASEREHAKEEEKGKKGEGEEEDGERE